MTETADAPEPCRRGQRFFPARALRKGGGKVPNYEVVREISNSCARNQMRDVFFSEIETEDPEGWVRQMLRGKAVEVRAEARSDGSVEIWADCDGLRQRFFFTPEEE